MKRSFWRALLCEFSWHSWLPIVAFDLTAFRCSFCGTVRRRP